ncbi:MAG: hypothetical protein JXQ90_20665 [Cyclobacteriaceae bacterium]
MEKIPKLESVGQILNGDLILENQIAFEEYKTLTPRRRYIKLQEKRPEVYNRVPQYHIASYLGIKPESLNRIRRRLALNKA